MRLGYLDLQVYLEGMEITRFVSEYEITFNKQTSPRATLILKQGPADKKHFNKVSFGTLVHIFFRDPSNKEHHDKYHLMYEGMLIDKGAAFDGVAESAELKFKGIGKILDDSTFTKVADKNGAMIDTFASDILYVNMGLKSYSGIEIDRRIEALRKENEQKEEELKKLKEKEKAGDLSNGEKIRIFGIPIGIAQNNAEIAELEKSKSNGGGTSYGVITNPSNIAQEYVTGDLWQNLKEKGKGYADLIKMLLESMTINSPYFKIIEESMRYLDQFVIYGHDSIKGILDDISAFKSSYLQSMSDPASLISYRSLLGMYLKYNFLKHVEVGLPLYDGKRPVQSMIIPDMDYTAPPVCNVIYPDEFNSYTLRENYDSEITRARITGPSIDIGSQFFEKGGSTIPVFLSPSNQLTFGPISSYGMKDSDRKIQTYLKFTKEEMYRGVNAHTSAGDVFEFAWIKTDTPTVKQAKLFYTDDTLLDPDEITDLINKDYQAMYRYVCDHTYLMKRLKARGTGQITVNHFNPSWIMGVPGLIITEESGPILAMFDSVTLAGSANGSCRSTISFSNPRYIDDLIPMDYSIPEWYHPDFKKGNIGSTFYKKFGTNSIVDAMKTLQVPGDTSPMKGKMKFDTSIETAAKLISNNFFKDGKKLTSTDRAFVEKDAYIEYIYRGKYKWHYREGYKVDAFNIAARAALSKDGSPANFGYLQCPFVLERGQAVKEWLGLLNELKIFPIPEGTGDERMTDAEKESLGVEYTPRYEKPVEEEKQTGAAGAIGGKVKDNGVIPFASAVGGEANFETGHPVDSAHPHSPYDGSDYLNKEEVRRFLDKNDPQYGKRFQFRQMRTDISNIFETVMVSEPRTVWPCLWGHIRDNVPGDYRSSTRKHDGVDIGTLSGEEKNRKIYAILSGKVTCIKQDGPDNKIGGGRMIQIDHGKYKSTYMHLKEVCVKYNDTVQQGQVIGIMGDTGCSDKTGRSVHLHFEVMKKDSNGRFILDHCLKYLSDKVFTK